MERWQRHFLDACREVVWRAVWAKLVYTLCQAHPRTDWPHSILLHAPPASNHLEGRNKRNPDLNPYRNVCDPRLLWLRNDFLEYIKEWERCVEIREGELTASQRAAMQLSHQAKTGLEISVLSITSYIEIILEEGVEFVLTHNFNQDPLEQYFGHLRPEEEPTKIRQFMMFEIQWPSYWP